MALRQAQILELYDLYLPEWAKIVLSAEAKRLKEKCPDMFAGVQAPTY